MTARVLRIVVASRFPSLYEYLEDNSPVFRRKILHPLFLRSKKGQFYLLQKSHPGKDFLTIFRYSTSRTFIFIPSFYCITKKLKGCFISENSLVPVVIQMSLCPFYSSSFLLLGVFDWWWFSLPVFTPKKQKRESKWSLLGKIYAFKVFLFLLFSSWHTKA